MTIFSCSGGTFLDTLLDASRVRSGQVNSRARLVIEARGV